MLGRQLSRQLSTQLSVPLPVLQEGAAPIHRVQGVWRNLEEDLAEPMRTERLLSRSLLNPFHARSTDCQHAMMPHLLIGTSGRSCVGLLSAWLGLVVQVAVGALSGIAPYLTAGDTGAKCQVLALGLLRLLWASVAVTFRPCADLVKNAVCACAFASEGTAAVLLYLAEWHDGISADAVDSLRLTSSLLLLIPVFLPIAEKVYDGVGRKVRPELRAQKVRLGGVCGGAVLAGDEAAQYACALRWVPDEQRRAGGQLRHLKDGIGIHTHGDRRGAGHKSRRQG